MNDPLCFPTLQPKSTESFLAASARLADTDALSKIRADLPMYLFSGSEDPIGQQLEGVRTLIDRYHKAGLRDVSHNFYESGRHEMLNELNRGQVRTNIMVWLSSVLHDQSCNREALCPRYHLHPRLPPPSPLLPTPLHPLPHPPPHPNHSTPAITRTYL